MLCPICKKPVDESEAHKPSALFPFCSERCKLIDLGRWLSGRYQIPVEPEESRRSTRADRDAEPDAQSGTIDPPVVPRNFP